MIKKLIPHVCISLSLVSLTFLVLGQFNPILTKSFVQVVLFLTAIAAILTSAFLIAHNRKA